MERDIILKIIFLTIPSPLNPRIDNHIYAGFFNIQKQQSETILRFFTGITKVDANNEEAF